MIALYNVQLELSGKSYKEIKEQLKDILIMSETEETTGMEIETNTSSSCELISIDGNFVHDMCDKCGYPILDKDNYFVEQGGYTHKDCSKRIVN